MTDPQEGAARGAEAAVKLQRVLALFAPNATNVEIKTVNHSPRQIQITDFRADLPDGSMVHAPHITIVLG